MMTKLGPFQILEEVGRGGMGTVYRGLDPVIGRPVAIKVIRLVGYQDGEEQSWMRTRLFREARAAGRLCHSGIVTIYQVGEEEDVAYIAMEFVDGPTLKQLLEREMERGSLCRILLEAAQALDYAHERGLVHRDIKPENIMVTSAGVTKVTDFGIAKTMLGQTATRTGAMAGTPLYMSPEQIKGKDLDGRSDQFALAVIAYRIFTGRSPFEAEHITSVCYQIIHEEPPSPEDIASGIGARITSVIQRGLSKAPEARFATCTEFAEALLDAYENRRAPARRPARLFAPKRPARGVTIALTTATFLLGAGFAFTRYPSRPVIAPPVPVVKGEQPQMKKSGFVVWTGDARQGDLLTITGGRCSTGSLSGALPSRPIRVIAYPGNKSAEGVIAFTSDAGFTERTGPVRFAFDPRHATDFTIFEAPSENQWDRMVVQMNTTLPVLVIEWIDLATGA